MRVSTQELLIMLYDDKPAVTRKSTPCVYYLPRCCGSHRITRLAGDTDTFFTDPFSVKTTEQSAFGWPLPGDLFCHARACFRDRLRFFLLNYDGLFPRFWFGRLDLAWSFSFFLFWLSESGHEKGFAKKGLVFYATWFFSVLVIWVVAGYSFNSVIQRYFIGSQTLINPFVFVFVIIDFIVIKEDDVCV